MASFKTFLAALLAIFALTAPAAQGLRVQAICRNPSGSGFQLLCVDLGPGNVVSELLEVLGNSGLECGDNAGLLIELVLGGLTDVFINALCDGKLLSTNNKSLDPSQRECVLKAYDGTEDNCGEGLISLGQRGVGEFLFGTFDGLI